MKRCYHCKLTYQDSEDFCASCGNSLLRVTFWDKYRLPILIGGSVVLVYALFFAVLPPDRSESSATSSVQIKRRLVYQNAIDRFRSKLMGGSGSFGVVMAVESSPVVGVARVQVSNAWYNSRPHQRRQLTQLLANAWANEMKGEPAILHIYDITGREIAGTKAFGGVWTEGDR